MSLLVAVGSTFASTLTAQAATNTTINYQARILLSSGALVPDGLYHLEFKIYDDVSAGGTAQGACSGNCLWVETRTAANTVRVVNGYVTVNLGSVTSFPVTMPWDQDLYITMRVGGDGGAAVWDTEMTNAGNRMKVSSVPYAFRAAQAFNVFSDPTSTASTNTNAIAIQTGNATGMTSNSGNVTIDSGTATGTTGTVSIGGTNASGVQIGRSGTTTQVLGATLNGTTALLNFGSNGAIGTAAATVDSRTSFVIPQTTASIALTLPSPTSTTAGRIVYVANTGTVSFTLNGTSVANGAGIAHIWNGTAWALVGGAGGGSTTLQQAYDSAVGGIITVTATDSTLRVRDATVSFGNTNVFSVQNNGGTIDNFGVQGDGDVSINTRLGVGTTAPTSSLHVTTAAPASVVTATGTAQIGVANLAGGVGGATTIATTGAGGVGGGFTYTGGTGGTAASALVSSTGGAGGATSLVSGSGGAAAVAGTGNNIGGAGGAFTLQSGAGGSATGATSGNNTAGNGGAFTLQAGTGGTATTGTGNLVGGTGGALTLSGGTGGVGATSGGGGGAVTLQGGTAAAMAGAAGGAATVSGRAGSSTGSGGNGGALTLSAGAAGGDNSISRTGGSIGITAGASRGASTGGTITVTAGSAGSNLTVAASVTGAASGGITFNAGSGGIAPNATTLSTGGAAGGFTVNGGVGGAASVGGTVNNTGGGGGTSAFTGGTGGAANGATSGTNTGGAGGAFTFQGGTGGAANTGSGNLIGGTGGALTFRGGTGGLGATSGGNGGGVTIQGGQAAAMAGAAGGAISVTGRAGSVTGTGGNGGALTLSAGAAGGDNSVSRTGGSVSLAAGGSVGGATGGAFTLSAGIGGNNAGTGVAVGGNSGGITLNANNGGTASGALISSTGGNSGGIIFNGGAGGNAAVAGTGANRGGNGGVSQFNGGNGGSATGLTSGINTGGNGGGYAFQAGTGGTASGGSSNVGGSGGALSFAAGAGGGGTTSGGNGGALTFQSGSAGAVLGAAGGALSFTSGLGSNVGTGGNGGSLTFTASAGRGDGSVARSGGALTLTAGASVGSAAGGAVTLTAGAGGINSTAGTATGGNAGGITFNGSNGGTAPNATVSSTGGTAGGFTVNGGTGGAAAVAGTGNNTGGNGGAFTLGAGTGGNATGATSGINTGGTGGTLALTAGNGGAATTGTGTLQGGAGGSLAFSAGRGGAGTLTGTGGDITFSTTPTTAAQVERLRVTNSGYVGIGTGTTTSLPNARLTVVAENATTSQIKLRSTRAAIVANNVLGGVDFDTNDSNLTAPGSTSARIQAVATATHTAAVNDTAIVFSTSSGIVLTERWRIGATGELQGNGASTVRANTGNLTMSTLTSGNVIINGAGTFEVQDDINITSNQFTNSASTVNTAQAIANDINGGNIGASAAATVDVDTAFILTQTTAGQTMTLFTPTSATAGRVVYVTNSPSSTTTFTLYSVVIPVGGTQGYIWNGSAWTALNVAGAGSGVTTVGTIDSQTKSADGAVISGSTVYLQTADATNPGLVSTGVQTIAGAKTLSSALTITAGGLELTAGGITNAGAVSGVTTLTASGLIQGSAGVTITGTTSLSTTAGNTLTAGNSTGAVSLTGSNGSSFVFDGVTVSTAEFNLLDGRDNALVDTNDAVATAITGTGALNAGSITSGFGSIDIGADTITSGLINGQTISASANFTGSLQVATDVIINEDLSVAGLTTLSGSAVADNVGTGVTGTTTGTGAATTTLTLTADAFSVNDVLYIDNAGQDYYTRVTVDPGTGSYTVSPAVSFDNGVTVEKRTIQNIGATDTDYASLTNRFFQGYFTGGVVVGTGSTTLSDGLISRTAGDIDINPGVGGEVNVNGTLNATTITGDGSSITNINSSAITGSTITGLDASNISSGTLSDAYLSSNVSLLNGSQTFSALKTFGAGATVTAGQTLTVNSDAFTDLTGTGLQISSGSLSVVYGSTAGSAVEGNTSISISAGTGLTGGSSITLGSGGTATLNVAYGSAAGTAVEGNTSITCASGSGNLSGGGNSITLGSGGTCNAITTNNAVAFTTSVTSPSFTGTGAVSLSSGGAGDLTLDSASNILILSDSVLRRTAAGTTSVQLNDTSNTMFAITNTDGTAVANLDVEGAITATSFSGNGALITALDASNISSGTLADTYLSTNVAQLNLAQSFSALKTFGAGATITAGQNFTVDGEAFTDLTGTGLQLSGSSLAVVYGSSAGSAVEGDTSVSVAAGTGLTGGSTITLGTGGTATLNVAYGSTSGTAVEGNTSITCASGSGNLTGGGNSITLGSGGSCNAITTNNAVSFSTSVTTPSLISSGALSIASASSGTITLDTGGSAGITIGGTNSTSLALGNVSSQTTINGTTIVLGTSTLRRTAAGTTAIELNDGADTTLDVTNTNGAGVANMTVEGSFTAASLAGSGSGITALDADNVATGTLTDSRLSSNVATLTGSQAFSGAKTFDAGAIITTGQTLTVNGEAFSEMTGTGLTLSTGTLAIDTTYFNANYIQLGSASIQTDTSTNSTIGVNKTGASGNLITLQKNAADVFVVGNSGALTISTTSTTALDIQSSGGTSTFTVDTSGNIVRVGPTGLDATAIMFVLDTKNTTGDPAIGTETNAQYYNSADGKNRCFENGIWTDCMSTRVLGETTLGVAAGTITVNLSANAEYLHCRVDIKSRSAASLVYLRFNGDSGAASYGWNTYSIVATAVQDAQDASDSEIQLNGTTTGTVPFSSDIKITNYSDIRKTVDWTSSGAETIGTQMNRYSGGGAWGNTASSISSLSFVASSGTFAAGSHAWCEGRDVR